LPKHIWQEASAEEFPFSQWNIEAIGSGPYKVSRVKRNDSGIPTYIELSSFKKYSLGRPFISKVVLRFFRDEADLLEAWKSGSLDGASGISPKSAKEAVAVGARAIHEPMSRVFGAFFNQNKAPVLANAEVRRALDASIDKSALVNEILLGFGTPLAGPVPENTWTDQATSSEARMAAATKMLLDAGWKPGADGVMEKKSKKDSQRLSFTISTGNVAELKRTAEIMRDVWKQLGAEVEIKIFESADLNRDVIRTRNYDVLLFGESLGHDIDLYPFWHSSQRIDPGLNISLYTNINADKLIEETRTSLDPVVRRQKSEELYREISKDVPAVFTYTPEFIYLLDPRVNNAEMRGVSSLSERFAGIRNWYVETDKVWKVFTQN
jgi:peptide/nickel transport system substrate-binding protein